MLPLYLASASPRRRELLQSLGVSFVIDPAGVDESLCAGETPAEHVVRLAASKAAEVALRLSRRGIRALVLAADTTVTIDGAILGKPVDADDALAMLRRLAGRRHDVITACRLICTDDGNAAAAFAATSVRFNPWNEPLARWYVATGEPMDKAGAYGLQGKGVLLSAGIDGSWSNVVGLPLEWLPGLFLEVGDDFARRMEGSKSG